MLSAREASCLCDALVRLYHLGMVGAFRHVLFQQQSSTQALQVYDELQQRLPVGPFVALAYPACRTQETHLPMKRCWQIMWRDSWPVTSLRLGWQDLLEQDKLTEAFAWKVFMGSLKAVTHVAGN